MNFFERLCEMVLSNKNFNNIKVKKILNIPSELYHIHDICHHEINNTSQSKIKHFYCDIYFNSLLEYYTMSKIEIGKNTINCANKYLRKSQTPNDTITNYQELSDIHHELYDSMIDKDFHILLFGKSKQDVIFVLNSLIQSNLLNIPVSDKIDINVMKDKILILK